MNAVKPEQSLKKCHWSDANKIIDDNYFYAWGFWILCTVHDRKKWHVIAVVALLNKHHQCVVSWRQLSIIRRLKNLYTFFLIFFCRCLCVQHSVRRGRRHFPVRLLGCQRLQGVECPDLPAEGQSAAQVQTHSLTSSARWNHRCYLLSPPPGSQRCPSSACRLVGVIGQHGQCWSELCELCGASCSTSTLVRLLQYYSSWAQLRDVLVANWTPQGEVIGFSGLLVLHVNNPPRHTYTESATIMYRQIFQHQI